ncbi:MAG: hypothetical protein QXR53_00175 [Candidatus Norongarragalinales archaeon]
MNFKEERIFFLSLFLSFAGIAVLFALSQSASAREAEVSQLSSEDFGRTVLLKGKAVSVSSNGETVFFRLCASACVKVVVFRSRSAVSEGAFVSVEGRVSEFEGRIEIIADSVEVLKS